MKYKEVSITYGRTVSTGVKFEFLRADAGLVVELEEGDDRKQVRLALRKECVAAVNGFVAQELEKLHG